MEFALNDAPCSNGWVGEHYIAFAVKHWRCPFIHSLVICKKYLLLQIFFK